MSIVIIAVGRNFFRR